MIKFKFIWNAILNPNSIWPAHPAQKWRMYYNIILKTRDLHVHSADPWNRGNRNANRKGFHFVSSRTTRERERNWRMAMATVRSALLRTAMRGSPKAPAVPKRGFASSAHHDEAGISLSLCTNVNFDFDLTRTRVLVYPLVSDIIGADLWLILAFPECFCF